MLFSPLYLFAFTLAAVSGVIAQGPIQFVVSYEAWDAFYPVACPATVKPTTGSFVENTCTNLAGYSFIFTPSAPTRASCTAQFFNATECSGASETVNLQSSEQSSCLVPTFASGTIISQQPSAHHAQSVKVDCPV